MVGTTFWLLVCWFQAFVCAADPFAVVFIDQATEARYGQFPLDRKLLADGITRINAAGAKGVIVKFFLDAAKSPAGDQALANAFSGLPCLLEACHTDSAVSSNTLPDKFFWKVKFRGDPVVGKSGLIPLKLFCDRCRDIGFVDFRSPETCPLIEVYLGKTGEVSGRLRPGVGDR